MIACDIDTADLMATHIAHAISGRLVRVLRARHEAYHHKGSNDWVVWGGSAHTHLRLCNLLCPSCCVSFCVSFVFLGGFYLPFVLPVFLPSMISPFGDERIRCRDGTVPRRARNVLPSPHTMGLPLVPIPFVRLAGCACCLMSLESQLACCLSCHFACCAQFRSCGVACCMPSSRATWLIAASSMGTTTCERGSFRHAYRPCELLTR